MYRYNFKIPMFYNYVSNYDTCDTTTEVKFILKNNIEYKLSIDIINGDFNSSENCDILITDNNDNSLLLSIDSIYADDENYAYDIACKFADKVCCVLTFILHSQNHNFNHFHPKLTYRIKDIFCKESNYERYNKFKSDECRYEDEDGNVTIHISDRISFKESTSNKITSTVNTNLFNSLFEIYKNNEHMSFVLESYYRGLGEIEFISKYYNFFTIIEYIESNFSKYANYKEVFSKNQKDELKKLFASKVAEYITENDEKNLEDRVNSRFGSLLKSITDKTRSEKLCDILHNYFDLYEVEFSTVNFSVTADTMKNFIDVRNSLFHAKRITDKEKNKLNILTNELMVLCTMLISKIISQCELPMLDTE